MGSMRRATTHVFDLAPPGLVGAVPIKSLRISWCRWAKSGQPKLLGAWHLWVLAEAEAWLPWAAMHYVLLLAAGHGQHAARDYTHVFDLCQRRNTPCSIAAWCWWAYCAVWCSGCRVSKSTLIGLQDKKIKKENKQKAKKEKNKKKRIHA